MSIRCKIFGHKWKYNFPISSFPNKSICKRCNKKARLDLGTLEWVEVVQFDKETRTDSELIKKWF